LGKKQHQEFTRTKITPSATIDRHNHRRRSIRALAFPSHTVSLRRALLAAIRNDRFSLEMAEGDAER
jgi:hypothetical protein